ncbi:MAG TPA: YlxM family DNA-binding protein [Syntrophomonadaceae bacterium]|nr:YlxM family DNA-binding protein [Syntrophomonadaceae bacterium]
MHKAGRMVLLYDFYGKLLTPKQQEVVRLYYEEDLSLGEIAEELKITRQAVYDILKRSEQALEKYERKLGLLEGDSKKSAEGD